MKVFMSMPLAGKTNEQIDKEKVELIPTFGFPVGDFVDGRNDEVTPLKSFAEAVKIIDDCDCIWLTPGWEESRGCRLEKTIAEAFDIPIYK